MIIIIITITVYESHHHHRYDIIIIITHNNIIPEPHVIVGVESRHQPAHRSENARIHTIVKLEHHSELV